MPVFTLVCISCWCRWSWCNKQEPTTDGFEWSSDSEEAIDRTLGFELASYAMVSAVEMRFPVGDTYKFDLELNDDKIRGEVLKTVTVRMSASTVAEVLSIHTSLRSMYIHTSFRVVSQPRFRRDKESFTGSLLSTRQQKYS